LNHIDVRPAETFGGFRPRFRTCHDRVEHGAKPPGQGESANPCIAFDNEFAIHHQRVVGVRIAQSETQFFGGRFRGVHADEQRFTGLADGRLNDEGRAHRILGGDGHSDW